MDRRIFNILVFRQARVLISVLIFALTFIWPLMFSTNIDNLLTRWTIVLITEVVLISTLLYFAYGRLIISTEGDQISFRWQNKFIFKYRDIKSIKLGEVRKIVLDENQLLKKIFTDDLVILINNNRPNKWFKSDSQRFIDYLLDYNKDVIVIDSWDEFNEKGYLKIAYKINTLILIASVIIMVIFIVLKGFHSRYLLFLMFSIPQILLYQIQMNRKIKNK